MPRIQNLDDLINAEDLNRAIIKLDDFICKYKLIDLTAPQKHFHFIQELEREVNNGGFHQYFWNSSGEFAAETIISLQEIGAHQTWPLLEQAIGQFPNGDVPKDWLERQQLVEQIEDNAEEIWNQLDGKFFEYQDNLNQLNINYIRNNTTDF